MNSQPASLGYETGSASGCWIGSADLGCGHPSGGEKRSTGQNLFSQRASLGYETGSDDHGCGPPSGGEKKTSGNREIPEFEETEKGIYLFGNERGTCHAEGGGCTSQVCPPSRPRGGRRPSPGMVIRVVWVIWVGKV